MPTTDMPIACTLIPGDRPARALALRELGERALVGVEVSDRRARLRFRGAQQQIDDLVAAESRCCGFFEFATTRDGEDTELEIRTPTGGEPLLLGLVGAIVAGWTAALD